MIACYYNFFACGCGENWVIHKKAVGIVYTNKKNNINKKWALNRDMRPGKELLWIIDENVYVYTVRHMNLNKYIRYALLQRWQTVNIEMIINLFQSSDSLGVRKNWMEL